MERDRIEEIAAAKAVLGHAVVDPDHVERLIEEHYDSMRTWGDGTVSVESGGLMLMRTPDGPEDFRLFVVVDA